MKIETFLEQIIEIPEHSQVKAIFSYWDEAIENYVLSIDRHSSNKVLHIVKIANSLGRLVDLYRGVDRNKYVVTEALIEEYNALLAHFHYKSQDKTLFELITDNSTMESRLEFTNKLSNILNDNQGEDLIGRTILRNLREGKLNATSNQIRTEA